ncbi:MAG: efflux RND transporter periplasmic adaptor subunit [Pseudomonadales bacterium]|jgi:RND family efflux transporter MFP subunit|nr:efflux RND transporter periplasmic adaptor subunit [Pseudomonadales bacterium]
MKFASWVLLVVVCLAITGGLGWYKYSQIRAAIAQGAAFPETVEAVEAFTVPEDRYRPSTRVPADVVAVRSVEVRTELEGRIVEVGFAPGARVDAGQLLLRLDISEERAQLAAARAEQEIARLALERAEKLLTTGAGTSENRDTARARFDAAVATADRLQAVIDKRTLRAPFAGRTGLHTFEAGQYLDAGALVTRLVGGEGDVWLDFPLPQQTATLPLGTAVTFQLDGEPRQAEIVARDAVVATASRNVAFRALARDVGDRLVPGMVVAVEVPTGEDRRVAVVPSIAVRRDTFGASVYVLEPAEEGAIAKERARRRSVEPGPERDGMTVVLAGLEPGERIAATGAFKLREGVLVAAESGGER